MGIKDILKNGATAINNVTKELKPYSTVIYVIIFIIIVAIFISFFSKAISNKLLNAYTGFTIIFAIWSFFSIAIDLLVDDGTINYGYVVSFVINAILGMITLYTIGKMKIFQTILAFFIMTLIFLVWLTDTTNSDNNTKNFIEKEIPNASSALLNKASSAVLNKATNVLSNATNAVLNNALLINALNFCVAENVGDKIEKIFNGFDYISNWWRVPALVFTLPLFLIMLFVWFCTGCFELLKYVFDKIAGSSSPSTTDTATDFISANAKDTIKWTAFLLLFMIVILVLFSSQSAMRKNPMGVFGIGIFISIIVLGYVRFFKLESFTTTFRTVMCALFALYLYLYNPYNIFDKMSGINLFAIFIIFFGIVGMLVMIVAKPDPNAPAQQKKTFSELVDIYSKKPNATPRTPSEDDKLTYPELFSKHYMKLIKGIIGLIVSIGFIMFLVASIGSLQSSDNNPTAGVYILNTLIVIGFLTIVFNLLDAKYKIRDRAGFKLFIEIILYIPCILSDLADLLMTEYYKTKYFTLVLVVLEIIFIICYWFLYERVVDKVYTGGGRVLINSPVLLNKAQTVGYYKNLSDGPIMNYTLSGKPMLDLSGNPLRDTDDNYIQPTKVNTYKFGISCWIYLNPMPSYGDKPLTILDYGSNPIISYSPSKNELTVNVIESNSTCELNMSTISVYTNKNPPIQKWFNLILNYDGGHLDIFLDSVLVQTSTDVISCVKYDALVIGQPNGLNAKMCNLIYFKTPLDIITVHNMFNITKIQDTPDIPKRNLFSI